MLKKLKHKKNWTKEREMGRDREQKSLEFLSTLSL